MFPPLNPERVKVDRLKRVVSFTYHSKKKVIYFRHYKIVMNNSNGSDLTAILNQKNIDLGQFATFGEYINSLKRSQPQEEDRVSLV